MHKRVVECLECGNAATIYTTSKEDPTYCVFCGEPIVPENVESDDDEDDAPLEDEDDAWRGL